jgi:hypothetical protein
LPDADKAAIGNGIRELIAGEEGKSMCGGHRRLDKFNL